MQSLNEMWQVEEEVQNQKQKAEFIQACLAEYGSKKQHEQTLAKLVKGNVYIGSKIALEKNWTLL